MPKKYIKALSNIFYELALTPNVREMEKIYWHHFVRRTHSLDAGLWRLDFGRYNLEGGL